MADNVALTTDMIEKIYKSGMKFERERIANYLLNRNIIRQSLFGNTYVAMNVNADEAIEMPFDLGADTPLL